MIKHLIKFGVGLAVVTGLIVITGLFVFTVAVAIERIFGLPIYLIMAGLVVGASILVVAYLIGDDLVKFEDKTELSPFGRDPRLCQISQEDADKLSALDKTDCECLVPHEKKD